MAPEDGYGGIELAKGIKSHQISFAFELFIIEKISSVWKRGDVLS